MSPQESSAEEIHDLAQARARIRELEAGMDKAIEVLLKRDEQLKAAEKRIYALEPRLEQHAPPQT